MRKRLFTTLLLTVIFILNSCASTDVSLLSFMPEDGEAVIDFEGFEFVLLTTSGAEASYDPSLSEDGGAALTVGQDALIARLNDIEETYNCTFTVRGCGRAKYNMTTYYVPQIVAGTADFSFITTNAIDTITLYNGGFIVPWNHTSLDLTDHAKYGNEIYLTSASFKGDYYGIMPAYHGVGNGFVGGVIVNNTILRDYIDINVHELKENKQWTFDRFKEILEACTVDIGSSVEIIPLTAFDNRILVTTSVLANGGQVVDYDETTGKYSYGLTSAKAVKGIEYARSLYDADLCSHEVENGANFWEDENSPFCLTHSNILANTMYVFEDIDFISFPYGPDVEYGSVCSTYIQRDTGYIVCPISADAELSADFVSIWFEEIPDYTKETIIDEFKTTMFFNEKSMEEYFYMSENHQYNYYAQFGDLHEKFDEFLASLSNRAKTITEQLNTTTSMFENQINKIFNDD